MELRVLECPGEEWDEFASRYTDLIFYQSLWSRALKEGLGGQPLYFCLIEGGEIVSGLPGVLLDFRIFKILYASIPFGHLIGESSFFPSFLELLEAEFRTRKIDQVRLVESPFSPFYEVQGFKSVSSRYTLLNIAGFNKERIWESYNKNIRRDIRKAKRSGVSLRQGTSAEDVKIFYRLYLSSMERNEAAAKYPFRWFEALFEELVCKGLGTFLFAELDQEVVAGAALVHSTTSTHYFHSGSRYEFLSTCPNELLIHASVERAIEKGNSVFDFMGSDSKDLSLIRFKEKWGSQSMDLRTYVRDYHPIRCKAWELGKRWTNSTWGSALLRLIRG